MSGTGQEPFQTDRYALFEGLIKPDHAVRLRADVDELIARRNRHEEPMIVLLRELALLTSHSPTMELLSSLMEGEYSLPHIHASRHDAGREGGRSAPRLRAVPAD